MGGITVLQRARGDRILERHLKLHRRLANSVHILGTRGGGIPFGPSGLQMSEDCIV